jgi:hypothetical protein
MVAGTEKVAGQAAAFVQPGHATSFLKQSLDLELIRFASREAMLAHARGLSSDLCPLEAVYAEHVPELLVLRGGALREGEPGGVEGTSILELRSLGGEHEVRWFRSLAERADRSVGYRSGAGGDWPRIGLYQPLTIVSVQQLAT